MNNHGTLLVLLDMSPAIDTLNHDALINRLFVIGFRTKAISIHKSYKIDSVKYKLDQNAKNYVSTYTEYPKAQYSDRYCLIFTYLQFLKYS